MRRNLQPGFIVRRTLQPFTGIGVVECTHFATLHRDWRVECANLQPFTGIGNLQPFTGIGVVERTNAIGKVAIFDVH